MNWIKQETGQRYVHSEAVELVDHLKIPWQYTGKVYMYTRLYLHGE